MLWSPRTLCNIPLIIVLLAFQSCAQCTIQHDPSQDRRLFEQERKYGNRPAQKLNEKGEVPLKSEGADAGGTPDEKYANYCASCHGSSGKADGSAGLALNPRPRNFTDKAWQDKTTDERILTVVKNGGASVGLSSAMAPWGAILSEDDIKQLIQKIRSFKGS